MSSAQNLEFGFGLGTGSTYLVENSDRSVNINYKTPVSVYTNLKYTLSDSPFGILLRYQYTNTSVNGQKWFENNQDFEAFVNDNSLFLLLEYLHKDENKLNFGGNVGLGYTSQSIDFRSESSKVHHSFPSVNISGVLKYKVNGRFSIRLEPGFQFFDPLNALKTDQYNFAKEDIHFLTSLGISYKL